MRAFLPHESSFFTWSSSAANVDSEIFYLSQIGFRDAHTDVKILFRIDITQCISWIHTRPNSIHFLLRLASFLSKILSFEALMNNIYIVDKKQTETALHGLVRDAAAAAAGFFAWNYLLLIKSSSSSRRRLLERTIIFFLGRLQHGKFAPAQQGDYWTS